MQSNDIRCRMVYSTRTNLSLSMLVLWCYVFSRTPMMPLMTPAWTVEARQSLFGQSLGFNTHRIIIKFDRLWCIPICSLSVYIKFLFSVCGAVDQCAVYNFITIPCCRLSHFFQQGGATDWLVVDCCRINVSLCTYTGGSSSFRVRDTVGTIHKVIHTVGWSLSNIIPCSSCFIHEFQ